MPLKLYFMKCSERKVSQCILALTVKTVKLYKKLYFFIKSLKSKKKKLALTSFYYVSREMWLGNSKKAYLHRPIKIPHFLTPARIQKCLT